MYFKAYTQGINQHCSIVFCTGFNADGGAQNLKQFFHVGNPEYQKPIATLIPHNDCSSIFTSLFINHMTSITQLNSTKSGHLVAIP